MTRQKPLIITLEYPPETGGIAEYVRNLVETIGAENIDVFVPPKGQHWLLTLLVVTKRCLFARTRPSAILVHHVLPIGTIAYIMHKIWRVPFVIFFHGYDSGLVAHNTGRKRKLANRIIHSASLVAANSHATLKNIETVTRQKLSTARIIYPCPSVLPKGWEDKSVGSSGVDFAHGAPHTYASAAAFRRETRGSEGAMRKGYHTTEPIRLLTVSRLVKRKGLEYTISAVEKLASQLPIQYVIIGDGPDRSRLESLINQKDLTKSIKLIGALPREKCEPFFNAADIFLMTPVDNPPDIEGFGIVYLEAAAFGKPAIGSTAGGVPDAVIDGKTGYIVPQKSVEPIAEKILMLAKNPEIRDQLGQQGRQRVISEFTWKKQLEPVLTWLAHL